jgi:hypothetical protein
MKVYSHVEDKLVLYRYLRGDIQASNLITYYYYDDDVIPDIEQLTKEDARKEEHNVDHLKSVDYIIHKG